MLRTFVPEKAIDKERNEFLRKRLNADSEFVSIEKKTLRSILEERAAQKEKHAGRESARLKW